MSSAESSPAGPTAAEVSRRLTRTGQVVLTLATLGAVTGRLLGVDELLVVAVVALVTIGAAFAVVTRWRPDVSVERSVQPRRIEVGGVCGVALTITNRSRRTSLVTTLGDRLDLVELESLRLAPIDAGEARMARYQFVARRRGVAHIGPLVVESTDPFGLARVTVAHTATVDVIVLPRTHRLAELPAVPGEDPESGVHRRRILVNANEEFATLREYVPGDDVRRVHWPSTARIGSPVVRHHEHPWQRRSTVLLDDRRSHHDPASFERAVSAAASVLVAGHGREEMVRLVTTSGRDSGFIDDQMVMDHLLNGLAAIAPSPNGSLIGAIRQLRAHRVGGRLISCVGTLPAPELAALSEASVASTAQVVIACRTDVALDARAGVVVRFLEDQALGPAWSDAGHRLGPR